MICPQTAHDESVHGARVSSARASSSSMDAHAVHCPLATLLQAAKAASSRPFAGSKGCKFTSFRRTQTLNAPRFHLHRRPCVQRACIIIHECACVSSAHASSSMNAHAQGVCRLRAHVWAHGAHVWAVVATRGGHVWAHGAHVHDLRANRILCSGHVWAHGACVWAVVATRPPMEIETRSFQMQINLSQIIV
jgi:hypothetical protein